MNSRTLSTNTPTKSRTLSTNSPLHSPNPHPRTIHRAISPKLAFFPYSRIPVR